MTRTFQSRSTVSFDVVADFQLTPKEYKQAIKKYGDLDQYAASEIDGSRYEAIPALYEALSDFTFRGVIEITPKEEI